jgi:hypothetical protein
MGGKIGFIIILIVALGIGLYLYSSGALVNGLSGFNSLISTSSTFSLFSKGSSTVQGPRAPLGPTVTTISAPPSDAPIATTTINPADIPAGFTMVQLSPYFHKIRFGGVSAANSYYYGTITLDTSFDYNSTTSIDITGWQIKSKNSGEYIPGAVNFYDASGLAGATDIYMKEGDLVYIYSSSAPFNLRLNKCIGYVANVAKFVPALPLSCPYVDPAAIQNFTGACQNYIQSIGGCQSPNMTSSQIPKNDYACQDYLQNHFTYKSCLSDHQKDPDFLSNEVRVWTGGNVVDQYHDKVELLDKKGLLVDLYTY